MFVVGFVACVRHSCRTVWPPNGTHSGPITTREMRYLDCSRFVIYVVRDFALWYLYVGFVFHVAQICATEQPAE